MSAKLTRWLSPMALCGGYLLAPTAAQAQTPPPPLAGESPFQQQVLSAIFKMCVNSLDAGGRLTPETLNTLQNDLHDQCHAIAIAQAAPLAGNTASTLGAISQVSGNEISAQGALSNRVVSGQFANISGRLDALRFGANAAIASGRVAATNSTSSPDDAYASAGHRSFYIDNTMLGGSGDGFAPTFAPPLGSSFQAASSNVAMVSGGPLLAAGPDAGSSGSSPASSSVANPWGVFVQGSYNSGHHDLTTNEDPFDFHAISVTAGVDYNFGAAVLGASLGYDDYDAGFNTSGLTVSGGSERVEGTSASLYGAWFGEHWTFNGIATYGKLTTSQSRRVDYTVTYAFGIDQGNLDPGCTANCQVTANQTFLASPDGHTVAVGATAGYQLSFDNWDIMPSLSANYRRADFSQFTEYNNQPVTATSPGGYGLALAYGGQTNESIRSILGVEISRGFSMPFGVLSPIVRGEWDHEFRTGVTYIQAHYANDPSLLQGECLSCFSIPTDPATANYGIVGAGLSVTLAHRVQAFVYDEVLVGYSDYRSNSIAFGARAQF
jgi:uncharacterized protein YhjY with autotransporter beta-barrel domain